ncbi:MAG: helix-hairpin-helix domain-containing protein [candidate division WOR-3 bacterium]|nr:helix-hairpin-helix domain-containing protein [candidate division WOR-3 bacterium]
MDGLTDNMKDKLIDHGYNTPEDIFEKGTDGLKEIDGIGKKTAEKIIQATEDFIKGDN